MRESSEWREPKRKKKGRRRQKKGQSRAQKDMWNDIARDDATYKTLHLKEREKARATVINKINHKKKSLQNSALLVSLNAHLTETVRRLTQSPPKQTEDLKSGGREQTEDVKTGGRIEVDVVAYGIGKISTSAPAQYQLALLLLLPPPPPPPPEKQNSTPTPPQKHLNPSLPIPQPADKNEENKKNPSPSQKIPPEICGGGVESPGISGRRESLGIAAGEKTEDPPGQSLGISRRVFVFDPVFSILEKEVIQELGFEIIPINEQGKHKSERCTLFYMPHCPRGMYNNVLWANWGRRLERVIILGNSLTAYAERSNIDTKKGEARCIIEAAPYASTLEIKEEGFGVKNVLNDLTLQTVTLPESLWDKRPGDAAVMGIY
ncbi:hypothetical protein AAMO2058_001212900 [Amorphochlora amoebiformis]